MLICPKRTMKKKQAKKVISFPTESTIAANSPGPGNDGTFQGQTLLKSLIQDNSDYWGAPIWGNTVLPLNNPMYCQYMRWIFYSSEFSTGLAYSAKNNKIRHSPEIENGVRAKEELPHIDGIPSPVMQKKNLHHTKSAPPIQYSRTTANLRRQVQFNAKK